MSDVCLPMVYEHTDTTHHGGRIIYPIKVSIDETMVPASTATMTMPRGELFTRNQVFMLYTISGLSGHYRIRSIGLDCPNDIITYQLEHMVAEVGDWCVMQDQSGNYSATNAIRRLWRGSDTSSTSDDGYRGTDWQLGSVTALSGITVELDAKKGDNLLSAILKVLDGCPGVYMTFNYETSPWSINFARINEANYGDYQDVSVNGLLTRNVSTAKVTWDFTDLCTRVRYKYSNTWYVYTADQTYRDKYGIAEEAMSTSGSSSLASAQYKAQEFMRKNQEPRLSISITGEDMYPVTGKESDRLEVGKLYKLVVPELGNKYRNIIKLSRPDVYGEPRKVSITLGDADPTLWGYLGNIKKK